MELFKTKYLVITVDEKNNHLITTWQGAVKIEEFKSGIDQILKLLKSRNMNRIINDTSELTLVSPEGPAYAAQKVKEFVEKEYFFKQAHIISRDVFAKFAVNNFERSVKQDNQDPINMYFDDIRQAKEWLLSFDNQVVA